MQDFDFRLFNDQEYALAVLEKNAVEDITRVLYPNDTTEAGKKLRLKQQYFLSSASLQDIIYRFKRENQADRFVCRACGHSAQRYAPDREHTGTDPPAHEGRHFFQPRV